MGKKERLDGMYINIQWQIYLRVSWVVVRVTSTIVFTPCSIIWPLGGREVTHIYSRLNSPVVPLSGGGFLISRKSGVWDRPQSNDLNASDLKALKGTNFLFQQSYKND